MSAPTYTVVPPLTDDCPAWCTGHLPSDPGTVLHSTKVTAGEYAIRVNEEDGHPALTTDDYSWMHIPEARAYAASIIAACDLIDATPTRRRTETDPTQSTHTDERNRS